MLRKVEIQVTTDALGAGNKTEHLPLGMLYAVEYDKGTFDNGVAIDLDFIHAPGSADITTNILAAAAANTSQVYYPRLDSCKADGTALTANDTLPLAVGSAKLAVTSGGNAKTGRVVLYILQDA